VDYHARITAQRLFLQSPKLAETLVLAEVKGLRFGMFVELGLNLPPPQEFV
jgi:hypothetical protein